MPEQQKNNVESQRAVIDARLAVIEQELRGLVLREKAVAEEGESKAAALKGAGKQGIEWSQFAIAPKKLQATKGIEAQRQKLEQEKQHLQTVKETLRAQETGKKEKLPERERQAVEHIEGVVAGTRAEVDRAPKEVKPAVVGLAGQAEVAGQKAVDTVRAVVRRGPNTGEPSPQPEKEKPMKEEKEKIKAEKKAEKEKETLTNRFAGLKAKRDALLADGFTPPAEISQYIETIDQDIGALQTLLDNNKFEKVKNSFASLRGKLDECANQIALAQNEAALTAQSQKVEEQKKPIKEAAPVIPEQKTEKQKFQIVGVEGKMEAGTHGSLGDYTVGDTLQVIDPKKVGADVNNAASLTVVGIAGDKMLIQLGEDGPCLLAEPKRAAELFQKALKEEPISGAARKVGDVRAEWIVADATAQRLRNPSTQKAAIAEFVENAFVSAQSLYPDFPLSQQKETAHDFVRREVEQLPLSSQEKDDILRIATQELKRKDAVESYLRSPEWTKKPDVSRLFAEERDKAQQERQAPPPQSAEAPAEQKENAGKQAIIDGPISREEPAGGGKKDIYFGAKKLEGEAGTLGRELLGTLYKAKTLIKELRQYDNLPLRILEQSAARDITISFNELKIILQEQLEKASDDMRDGKLGDARTQLDSITGIMMRANQFLLEEARKKQQPEPSGEATSPQAQKPSLLSRIGARVKGFFRKGADLDKRATETIQKGEASLVEKLRQVPWKEKISGIAEGLWKPIDIVGIKTAGSMFGFRSLHDIPMYFIERKRRETVMRRTMRDIEGVVDVQENERNQKIIAVVEKLQERLKTKGLKKADRTYFRTRLQELFSIYKNDAEGAKEEQSKQIQQLLNDTVQANVTGVQAVRETLNTALVLSGGIAARGFMYGAMALKERYDRVQLEQKKKKEEFSVLENVVLDGMKETFYEMGGGGKVKAIEGKTLKGKFTKAMTVLAAWGVVARGIGIGGATFHPESLHWDQLKDLSFDKIDDNFLANAHRVTHPFGLFEGKESAMAGGSAALGSVATAEVPHITEGGAGMDVGHDTNETISSKSFDVDNHYGRVSGKIEFRSSPEAARFMEKNGITFNEAKCRYEFANNEGKNYLLMATDRMNGKGDGKIDIASVKLTMDDGELRITTFSHPDSDGNVHVAHLVTDGKDLTQFDGDVNYDYATHDVRAVVSEKGTMTKIAMGDVDEDGLMDRSKTADLADIHLESWKDGSGVSHTREAIGALRLQNGDVLHTTLLDANNDSVITDKDIAEGLYVATKGDETTIDSFIAVPSSENGKFPDGMTLRETLQEMHRLDPTISESLNIKDAQGVGHAQEVFRDRLNEAHVFQKHPFLKGHMQEAQALGITRSGNAVGFGTLDQNEVESLFNDKEKLTLCYEGGELNKDRLQFAVKNPGDMKDYLGALFSATDETNARLRQDWSYEDFSNTIGKEMEKVPLNFEANSNGVVATIDGNQYLFTKGFVQKVNMLSDKYSLSSAPPSPIRNAILEYGNPVVLSSIVDRQKFHEALSLAQNQSAVTH